MDAANKCEKHSVAPSAIFSNMNLTKCIIDVMVFKNVMAIIVAYLYVTLLLQQGGGCWGGGVCYVLRTCIAICLLPALTRLNMYDVFQMEKIVVRMQNSVNGVPLRRDITLEYAHPSVFTGR